MDGRLMGAPPKHGVEERSRTYFDLLTVSTGTGGPGDISITLSLDAVVVEGEGRDILPINQQGSVRRQGVTVTVDNRRSCWLELAKDIQFLVLFHKYEHPTYLQKAHLGFYIIDGRGLSASTQGLLGTAPGVRGRHPLTVPILWCNNAGYNHVVVVSVEEGMVFTVPRRCPVCLQASFSTPTSA